MVLPVNRCQSPISTASANPVSVDDPAQAAQPVHHRGELAVGGHRRDGRVEAVPARLDRQDRLIVGLERQPGAQPTPGAADAATRRGHRSTPARRSTRCPAAAAASTPVPGPHQVPAAVLPSPHQVPRRLLVDAGHRHRRHLVQAQQPRQVQRVTLVGLDPVAAGPLQLRSAPRPDTARPPRSAPGTARTPSGRPHTSPPPSPAGHAPTAGSRHGHGVNRALNTSPVTPSTPPPPPIVRAHPVPHSYAQKTPGPPTHVG